MEITGFKLSMDLDYGIDHGPKTKSVSKAWQMVQHRGQNCNSLDAIMAPVASKTGKVQQQEHIESLGAKGARAYTVTFNDRMLNMYKEDYLEKEINRLTKMTKGVIDHEFISEYSKTGRFHMHGAVLTKDVKTLANLNRKYGKFGICKCKVITNSVGWAKYCDKPAVEIEPITEVKLKACPQKEEHIYVKKDKFDEWA